MWLALLFFLAILLILAYLDTRKPPNYPPGPKWIPIFGSALLVNDLRKKTGYLYAATAELVKQYGPVIGLKIGTDKQVICYSHDAIKQILTDDDFAGRPTGIFYRYVLHNLLYKISRILGLSYEPTASYIICMMCFKIRYYSDPIMPISLLVAQKNFKNLKLSTYSYIMF